MRPRKLLLHRREIERLDVQQQEEQRLALVPLRVYFTHGIAKVEIGAGRGQARVREASVDREARGAARDGAAPSAGAASARSSVVSAAAPYTRMDNCIWGCTGFDLDVHRLGEAGRDPGCHVKRRTKHKRR